MNAIDVEQFRRAVVDPGSVRVKQSMTATQSNFTMAT